MPGFDESIYNLVPLEQQVRTASPKRMAKSGKKVEVTGSTFGYVFLLHYCVIFATSSIRMNSRPTY